VGPCGQHPVASPTFFDLLLQLPDRRPVTLPQTLTFSNAPLRPPTIRQPVQSQTQNQIIQQTFILALPRSHNKERLVLLRVNLFPIQLHHRQLLVIQPDPLLTIGNTSRNVKPEPVTYQSRHRQHHDKHRQHHLTD